MNVQVKLYGVLRRFRPAGAPGEAHTPCVVALPPLSLVETLLAQLGIPEGLAAGAAVNDDAVETDHPLRDGDRVSLFPHSAGGQGFSVVAT